MPRQFYRETVLINIAATGTTHEVVLPIKFHRGLAMQMTLIIPDYTAGAPTTTISLRTSGGVPYFTDSARAENSTFNVALGNVVIHPGDIVRATLSADAGGATMVTCIFHMEE